MKTSSRSRSAAQPGREYTSNIVESRRVIKWDSLLVIDLQPCWYPDVEDTDIDCRNENRRTNHDGPGSPSIRYDDADTIDDDLEQELDLDTPPE